MRRLLAPLLLIGLAGCDGGSSGGLVLMIDEGYRAEVLGTSRDGFAAPDGLRWHAGTLYIADEGGSAVRAWTAGAAPRLLAEGGGISSPEDLVRDARGTIYFSDDSSGGVFGIEPGGRLSRLAGPQGRLGSTEAIALSPAGELLVGDRRGHRILRVAADGRVSTFIGEEAGIGKPESMAFDEEGDLYIADNEEDVLYLRTVDGRLRRLISGREGFSPESLWHAGGFLYITDSKHGALHRYSREGGLETVAAFRGELANVQGVTGDEAGNLYVSVQSDLQAGRGYILRLTRIRPPAAYAGRTSG